MKCLNFTIKENSIGWLEWNQAESSVNLLSLSLIEELSSLLKQIEQAKPKALVLISKKANSFCAGADIKEIQKIQTEEEMQKVLSQVHNLFCQFEKLKLFKIAGIEGACMGGGLEWALCFDYLLLSDSKSTQLALPEVKLGLIPGFGGCLRLPRRIGLKQSLPLILKGYSINSKQALKISLADERVPSLVLETRAMELAKSIVEGNKKIQGTSYKKKKAYSFFIERTFKFILCFLAKKQVLKKTKGFYPAPLKALEVIQKTYGSFISEKNIDIEKQAFCKLFQTPESKNLIRIFRMINKAKKITHSASAPETNINSVAVLGAGVMGRAIAWLIADKGFKVRLIDNNEQSLCSSISWARKLWEQKKYQLSSYELKQKIDNFSVSKNFWGFSNLDLVIEALPENQKLKQDLIKDVSKKLKPECLFASNTSSLSISELAKSSVQPENFFGLHFFNPAHKMPLVEVVLTKEQKQFPLNSIKKFLKKIEKTPLLVKDSPGFVINKILSVYLAEAFLLFEEGNDIETIDYCYREQFGLPLGPFQLMDKVGLDICTAFISHLEKAGQKLQCPSWVQQLPQILGQGEKSGQGFYIYSNKKISLNKKTKELQKNSLSTSNKKIIQRGIYRMINEGKRLIEDQIVLSEEDIDLALVMGIGFPPFLGGAMNYAKSIGFLTIKKQLEEFSIQYGERFKACF